MSSTGSPVDDRRGKVDASGVRVAILTARFNDHITDSLLAGAMAALREHGATDEDLTSIRVPPRSNWATLVSSQM